MRHSKVALSYPIRYDNIMILLRKNRQQIKPNRNDMIAIRARAVIVLFHYGITGIVVETGTLLLPILTVCVPLPLVILMTESLMVGPQLAKLNKSKKIAIAPRISIAACLSNIARLNFRSH